MKGLLNTHSKTIALILKLSIILYGIFEFLSFLIIHNPDNAYSYQMCISVMVFNLGFATGLVIASAHEGEYHSWSYIERSIPVFIIWCVLICIDIIKYINFHSNTGLIPDNFKIETTPQYINVIKHLIGILIFSLRITSSIFAIVLAVWMKRNYYREEQDKKDD